MIGRYREPSLMSSRNMEHKRRKTLVYFGTKATLVCHPVRIKFIMQENWFIKQAMFFFFGGGVLSLLSELAQTDDICSF